MNSRDPLDHGSALKLDSDWSYKWEHGDGRSLWQCRVAFVREATRQAKVIEELGWR